MLLAGGRVTGVVCRGKEIACDAVILATGGASYPATGSTGEGYRLAAAAGHTIVPIRPALVPLETSGVAAKKMAGLNLRNISVGLRINGKRQKEAFGELIFAEFGVTGPTILTLSGLAVDAVRKGRPVELTLDLNRRFYFKGKTYYDPYDQRMRRYSFLASFNGTDRNHISLEYDYWRNLYEILQFDTRLSITSWLVAFVRTRYDYQNNEDFDTDIGIEYHSQCWGLRVWFESDGGTDDTRSDNAVKTMFFIKGFGDRDVF